MLERLENVALIGMGRVIIDLTHSPKEAKYLTLLSQRASG